MQRKHAQDADNATPPSGAPATPRVSGEVARTDADADATAEAPLPESSTRAAQPEEAEAGAPGAEPHDTLLSAGKPAERLELLLEDGLTQIEARLRDLDARLAVLEQKKPSPAVEARHKPWLWIVFLVALVVVFQMLQRMR